MNKLFQRSRGFTLLELVVVMTIIGFLATTGSAGYVRHASCLFSSKVYSYLTAQTFGAQLSQRASGLASILHVFPHRQKNTSAQFLFPNRSLNLTKTPDFTGKTRFTMAQNNAVTNLCPPPSIVVEHGGSVTLVRYPTQRRGAIRRAPSAVRPTTPLERGGWLAQRRQPPASARPKRPSLPSSSRGAAMRT